MAFTLFLFAFAFVLLVNLIITGAEKEDLWSVFLKVLMNHLQMLIVFSSFDIDWPERVRKIFAFALPIEKITDTVISFDCFLDKRNVA